MKLPEALQERADVVRSIDQLRRRLSANVRVQEGENPAEDPEELRSLLDSSIARLSYLAARINLTNACTTIEGPTITELIAKRDALSMKIGAYREAADNGNEPLRRMGRLEIKILPAIDVAEWRAKIDSLSKELRLLDNQLQATNWSTELIE